MDAKEILPSKKKQIDCRNSIELWPKSIIEFMQWFHFKIIMLHISDKIKSPAEHLKLFLKLFLMSKIRIWYDGSIGYKYVPEAVGIMRISSGNKYLLFVIPTNNRKLHHSFYHKSSVSDCWFILDHTVEPKNKCLISNSTDLLG